MIKVKNNESGDVEELPDDSQLPDLVASGKVSIPKRDYEFVDDVGEKYKVPAKSFLEAVKAGWKYRDENIIKDEGLEKKYGDSPVKATGLGLARSLSFGLTDVALEKTGLMSEEDLRETDKRNSAASTIGEVGGAVIPALLSGGSSLVAKAASKTLPGIIASQASKQGSRAAMNITSRIAKSAIEMGVTGAIEGGAAGLGNAISEAELGNADFNAESIMTNVGTGLVSGAIFGGGIGAGTELIKKASKGVFKGAREKAIKSLKLPAAEESKLLSEAIQDETMDVAARVFSENTEIAEAADRLGLKPTQGVVSNSFITKGAEESLQESPSLAGMLVRKETEPFREGLQKTVGEVVEKGTAEAYDAGMQAKHVISQGINERLRPAQEGLKAVYNTFGNFDISERMAKMVGNRIAKSDLYKLSLDGGLVNEIKDTLVNVKTLNQASMYKKNIGKRLAAEFRKPERNMAVIDVLDDVYGTLSRLERRAISDAAESLGPKVGQKAKKEALKLFDDSMQRYRDIYKDYTPVADALGLKLKSADAFLDNMADIDSEKFTKKLLSLTSYDSAVALRKSHPEVFEIARKQKLGEFANKIKDPNGDISPRKFLTAIEKMSTKEKEILFGFSKKTQQKIDDLRKVIKALPKDKGSRTSVNLSFLDMLNPVFQGKEMLRYAVYRGGDKAIKDYLLKSAPAFTAIESASNKSKNSIATSVNGFFKASSLGITAGLTRALSDKEIEKARENYAMIQSNPGALVDRFAANNKALIESAPNTANALQQRIIAGVQFLQSKTPHRDQDYIGESLQPSRSEMIKFNDYVEAVEKPQVVYEQLKQGYLNPNTLETLKVVYPRIHAAIQAEVTAKLPKQLTRAQKIQLQPLLGSKVTPSMDYNNLMKLQGKTKESSIAKGQAESQMNTVPMTAGRDIKASERSETGLDKALNRT